MLVHIVMWRLHEQVDGQDRAASAREIKTLLESLPAQVPSLRSLQVGIQALEDATAWDVVLHCTFDDAAGLAAYQEHPAHLSVAKRIGVLRKERAVVDYLV